MDGFGENKGIINDRLGLIIETAAQAMKIEAIVGGNYNNSSKLWGMMDKLCTRSYAAKFTCCDTYFYVCKGFSRVFSRDRMDYFDGKEFEKIINMIPELEINIMGRSPSSKNLEKFCSIIDGISWLKNDLGDMEDYFTFTNLLVKLEVADEVFDIALIRASRGDYHRHFFMTAAIKAVEEKIEADGIDQDWNAIFKEIIENGSMRSDENAIQHAERIKQMVKSFGS